MTITLRPAKSIESTELDTLLDMIQALYKEDGYAFPDRLKAQQSVVQLIDNPAFGSIWMIEENHQPIGYVVLIFSYSLEYGGRSACIDELYLQPAYRGKNIGTQALQFMESICRSHSIQLLQLEVQFNNPRAQALYSRLGFEVEARSFMRKRLS
jgi:ribosomal protein S18 acetylase RimI-like enzyme